MADLVIRYHCRLPEQQIQYVGQAKYSSVTVLHHTLLEQWLAAVNMQVLEMMRTCTNVVTFLLIKSRTHEKPVLYCFSHSHTVFITILQQLPCHNFKIYSATGISCLLESPIYYTLYLSQSTLIAYFLGPPTIQMLHLLQASSLESIPYLQEFLNYPHAIFTIIHQL